MDFRLFLQVIKSGNTEPTFLHSKYLLALSHEHPIQRNHTCSDLDCSPQLSWPSLICPTSSISVTGLPCEVIVLYNRWFNRYTLSIYQSRFITGWFMHLSYTGTRGHMPQALGTKMFRPILIECKSKDHSVSYCSTDNFAVSVRNDRRDSEQQQKMAKNVFLIIVQWEKASSCNLGLINWSLFQHRCLKGECVPW